MPRVERNVRFNANSKKKIENTANVTKLKKIYPENRYRATPTHGEFYHNLCNVIYLEQFKMEQLQLIIYCILYLSNCTLLQGTLVQTKCSNKRPLTYRLLHFNRFVTRELMVIMLFSSHSTTIYFAYWVSGLDLVTLSQFSLTHVE